MNKGLPHSRADENVPETVKFEIYIRPIFSKSQEKNTGKNFIKDWVKEHSKEYDQDCGKDLDKEYEKNCEKDRKKNRKKNCEQDCDINKIKDNDYDIKNKNLSICADHYCISEEITIKSCDDLVCFNLGDIFFKQNGFILELSLKLKDVCPKRRIALAVILYELDKCEKECIRGFRTVILPSASKYACSDICVDCLRFVVPEALVKNDDCDSCGPRKFVIRFIANYVDSDFSVCGCEHKV
jgi:hypothetical protein